VVQRGSNRRRIFFDPVDNLLYQDYLLDAILRYGVRCHAFCQMPDHVHLLLTPDHPEGISQAMSLLGNRFLRNFSARRGRSGTLWEGRHLCSPVRSDEHFWAVSQYIETNPVRAALARSPAGYYWSSYAHNALGKPHALVSPHDLYLSLGESPAGRQRSYRRRFAGAPYEALYSEIRHATLRGIPMGETEFGGVEKSATPPERRRSQRRDH